MKRSSILSFGAGLLIVVALSSFTRNPTGTNNQVISFSTSIRYQVNVFLGQELSLCNTYVVQVYDQNNNLVAPAQAFVPGKTTYYFFETGPVVGLRYATIKTAGFMYICSQQLVTPAQVIYGQFMPGTTYYFQLYPKVHNIQVTAQ
jgi:hypothetical protein